MKKNLALLLAAILLLTSMLGLTSAAETEAQAAQAPSQEIAFFNVSVKVGARLLFAVPADGYDVSPVDGSVENLELLVWEEGASGGSYSRLDAVNNGTILKSQGTQKIGDKRYIVFSYNELSASEMSKVVYARVLTTDSIGLRTYGRVYDYSVAEFANGYLNKESSAHKGLVEAMMDYGHFAADYKGVSSYTAEEAKALKKVSVTARIDGTDLFTQTTQLVSAGTEVTLKAPLVDGCTFSSWGEGVTDGKITVTDDVELVANYDYFEFLNWDFQGETAGAIKDRYSESDFLLNGEKYAIDSGSNKNWAMGSVASAQRVPHELSQYEFVVDPNNPDNICAKLTHTGAGEVKLVDSISSFKGTGVGDTIGSVTLEFDVTASENGTLPYSEIRIDRFGDATAAANGSSISLLRFNHNGDVVLHSDNSYVIATASANESVRIAVTLDFSNNTLIGYVNGVEVCSKSGVMSATNVKNYLASLEAGINTRFRLSYYGGYLGSNMATVPTSLIEDGTFTFTKVDALEIKTIGSSKYSQCYTKNSDGTYQFYNVTDPAKVPAGTELYTAVVDYDKFTTYLEANHSLYFDNMVITYNSLMAK